MEIISVLLSRLTFERGLALFSFITITMDFLFALIVYIKIVRKLHKIKPELKYAKIELMPPILSHMSRSLDYAVHIVRDKHQIRDVLQRNKVVCEFHFRKYCTKFDVFLSYALMLNTALVTLSIIMILVFYVDW